MRFVNVVLLAMLLNVAPSFAQTHSHTASPVLHYYAAVDLGSSGTKGQLYSLAAGEGREPDVLFSKIVNTKLVSSMRDGKFTPDGIADATNAVTQVVDAMKAEAAKEKIQVSTYYIVGSSGAAMGTNKQDLVTAVKAATGIDMDFVDAKTEGYYGLVSAVPGPWQATSIYIDIGSGNTKLGCVVGQVDMKNFKALEIPYGSKSVLAEARKRNPSDVVAGIASVMTDIGSNYDSQSQDIPCLRNRKGVFWSGGAAWATASMMHPEAALQGRVAITRRDLDRFIGELQDGTWNQKNPVFTFPKDMSPARQAAIRKKALSEINDSSAGVINVFTREQVLSGVSIMKTVLNASNPTANLQFVRESDFVLGFALDKFKHDQLK